MENSNKMDETIKTAAQQVEDLVNAAQQEAKTDVTKGMVMRIKSKLAERRSAAKVVANIDREISELKIQLTHELEAL